jgi:hypothetical protein
MAILVAAGGAALGTALGVGPAAGWLAGAALGNLLFPTQGPDSRVEGPRLGDLTVTASAYGAPIAVAYGTIRLAGNLIWSSGIGERQNVTRTRAGGKGGGGPR